MMNRRRIHSANWIYPSIVICHQIPSNTKRHLNWMNTNSWECTREFHVHRNCPKVFTRYVDVKPSSLLYWDCVLQLNDASQAEHKSAQH